MRPIDFPQANFTWLGTMKDADNLRVHIDRDRDLSISCWEMEIDTPFDWFRKLIGRPKVTKRVWLWVWGRHPHVAVDDEYPFTVPEDHEIADEPLTPRKFG